MRFKGRYKGKYAKVRYFRNLKSEGVLVRKKGFTRGSVRRLDKDYIKTDKNKRKYFKSANWYRTRSKRLSKSKSYKRFLKTIS